MAQQNLENVLTGPTSTPPLISGNSINPQLGALGAGGAGGNPGGALPGMMGNNNNAQGADGSAIQDIFNSVGKMDYGDLPPPIRKASPEFSGSGGEGEAGEGLANMNNSNAGKKELFVNELVFLDKNPRSKGLGLMALVGYQVKDMCQQGKGRAVGLCRAKRERTSGERSSLEK